MIFDFFGNEVERFILADLDRAVIHDAGQWRHSGELPGGAGPHIGCERCGGRDKIAPHFDHRVRSEIKSVGIGQNDGAIGVQRAPNCGWVVATNIVKDN